jgi:hypothetical protein
MAEIDWNECIPFEGEEKDLPLGEQTKIPNFRAIDLVKRWEVLDVESDEGFRLVKTIDLKPNDIVIGAQINENAVKAVVKTYGKRFFVAARADAKGKPLDRWQWEEMTRDPTQHDKPGQDVLELEALKQIRQSLKGGKKTEVFSIGGVRR